MNKGRPNTWAKRFALAILIVLLFCVPAVLQNDYWLFVFCLAWINVLLASSLRTIYRTGELSLGQVGFMLLGAYSSALLSMRLGIPVWLTILVGGLFAAAVALLLSLSILRTKGVYFSVFTFLVAEIFRLAMWYTPSLSGGPAGLSKIPPPGAINLLGITLDNLYDKEQLLLPACGRRPAEPPCPVSGGALPGLHVDGHTAK